MYKALFYYFWYLYVMNTYNRTSRVLGKHGDRTDEIENYFVNCNHSCLNVSLYDFWSASAQATGINTNMYVGRNKPKNNSSCAKYIHGEELLAKLEKLNRIEIDKQFVWRKESKEKKFKTILRKWYNMYWIFILLLNQSVDLIYTPFAMLTINPNRYTLLSTTMKTKDMYLCWKWQNQKICTFLTM